MGISNSHKIKGHRMDMDAASKLVSYEVPYTLVAIAYGQFNLGYNKLVEMVAEDEYCLLSNKYQSEMLWCFSRPFTVEMWCATSVLFEFFALIGVVIELLDHQLNNNLSSPPKLATISLISFSTMFKGNQNTKRSLDASFLSKGNKDATQIGRVLEPGFILYLIVVYYSSVSSW
ncbi:Glutamate receptor 3.7 [Vitis vinifera]|uniref:Glutamate receptor 3.7 n=1 Tax=Vitis vinifera TaxID=29760 RepID=A0A438JGL3_VITVI|nr:Glutamate receptor 3.7 [Vitis vinifera]